MSTRPRKRALTDSNLASGVLEFVRKDWLKRAGNDYGSSDYWYRAKDEAGDWVAFRFPRGASLGEFTDHLLDCKLSQARGPCPTLKAALAG